MRAILILGSLLLAATAAAAFRSAWNILNDPPEIAAANAPPASEQPTGDPDGDSLARLGVLNASDYSEIGDRPPFARARRPVVERPTPEQAARPAPRTSAAASRFSGELKGVVFDGDRRLAILVRPGDPKINILGRGDEIDGWRLELISEDRVVLRNGAARADLPLLPD